MLTFGRNSCRDVLKELKENAGAFYDDPLNQKLANQCAIDAWSLCDWVFEEHGASLGMKNLKELQNRMKAQCSVMALFQDVANATKHRTITQYTPQLQEARYHRGAFSQAFSSAFDISALFLVSKDGTKTRVDAALKEAIQHWEQFFFTHGLP